MTSHDMGKAVFQNRKNGFTLVEILVAMAILAVLTAICVPNFIAYRRRAEYAAIQATMRYLMDAEDLYFIGNEGFYPHKGIISIPKGAEKSIPELRYTFSKGHKHSYFIFGLNTNTGKKRYNYYYICVYSDFDFNDNGQKDIFIAKTCIRNGRLIYNRKIYQYR